MSFEFLNAENRNNGSRVRRCSYCRIRGHTINGCNNIQLILFENNCMDYIRRIREMPNIIDVFLSYLLDYAMRAPELVKTFAIRKCNATTRSYMDVCITNIILYFRPEIENIQREPRNNPITANNVVSQLIPLTYEQEQLVNASLIDLILEYNIYERRNTEVHQNRKFQITTEILETPENVNEPCECNICYETNEKVNFVKVNCGHEFCKECIKKTLQNETKNEPCCAFCRTKITNFELRTEKIKEELCDLLI